MPLLTRLVASPLFIDVSRGALRELPGVLAGQRISAEGRVLVAVGKSQGPRIEQTLTPGLPNARFHTVPAGDMNSSTELEKALSADRYDALVGVGGGRTLDVAKYAATRTGTPMVAVATNLAHDGICSPVSSLEFEGGKGSFGVAMPIAVLVDLDLVKTAPPAQVRSGIGDTINNLSAIEDWKLAAARGGEPLDGLAVTFARTAAESVLYRPGTIEDDDFLVTLAEALILSGMAMAVAGTSQPSSGACHEIVHAIDELYPGTASHGELAGVGALFASTLRDDPRTGQLADCLQRHGLPRTPADIGLTQEQFARAVVRAPDTRPTRFTILEQLALDAAAIRDRVAAFSARYAPDPLPPVPA